MESQDGDFASPTSIEDLKAKMKLRGKVTKVQLVGAFVDVGVGRDGLVHISRLSKEPVRNVSDILSEGQEITVWVRKVDKRTGRIDLTCVEPIAVEWGDIENGQVYTGKVTRVENFGAFVDVGAERPGLVHVSELSSDYVGNTTDVIQVGDEVRVKVLKVDRRKRQIDLSIKALGFDERDKVNEVEEEEKLPTAMAIALKRAMTGTEEERPKEHRAKAKATSERKKQELEDIITRTLQQHQRQQQ